MTLRGMGAMSRAWILEVRVGALESTLSCYNMQVGEVESRLASNNSDSDSAEAELESTKRRLRFHEGGDILMQEPVRNQGLQTHGLEASCVPAECQGRL